MTTFKEEPELREEEVIPVRVHWVCPQGGCGGNMISHPLSMNKSFPNPHTCDECGYEEVRSPAFPYIDYREKPK